MDMLTRVTKVHMLFEDSPRNYRRCLTFQFIGGDRFVVDHLNLTESHTPQTLIGCHFLATHLSTEQILCRSPHFTKSHSPLHIVSNLSLHFQPMADHNETFTMASISAQCSFMLILFKFLLF